MVDEMDEIHALQDVLRVSRQWCAVLDSSSRVAQDLDRLGAAAMKAIDQRLADAAPV